MSEQKNGQIVKSASTQIEAWMNDGKMMERIQSALSGYLDARTFAAQCVLAAKDKHLSECTPTSLFEALISFSASSFLNSLARASSTAHRSFAVGSMASASAPAHFSK